MEKQTPLYSMHEAYQGKIVPFAGYLLPVQYANGILHEHRIVREKAGLFDVSHMGEFILRGSDALANLNYLLTNDYTNMMPGQARYGIMCYENGTAVDDLLVYKKQDNDYLLVVNASNIAKDYAWILTHLRGEADLSDISEQLAQIALQGPSAEKILSRLTAEFPLKNYTFVEHALIDDLDCLISRTGYTGEDGFEIYCAVDQAVKLWQTLMQAGAEDGLEPCGLGCRDTLRMEAAMPLYGHELSDQITPLESNLSYFIKLNKDFIGKDALEQPPLRRRVGLKLIDRGISRENCPVYLDNQLVGITTSGTFSPTLEVPIAMALLTNEAIDPKAVYTIEVRQKRLKAQLTALPFYKRKKKEESK